MRTLKYAILGLINRQPMTGYDITREFNNNQLANFWYAKHSQVYPELNRLTDEGLITCEIIIQGEKMEKKQYSITSKGYAELKSWLLKDEPLEPTPKDIFRLRMYFSDQISPEETLRQLRRQLEKHTEKKKYLTSLMDQNYPDKSPRPGTPAFGDFAVLEGAILRENAYIQWLRNCLSRML